MFYAAVLAILASTSLTVGLYLLKRQAERLPSLSGGWRLGVLSAFAHDPIWVLGALLQLLGYALYMLALGAAPLSIVHTALNGGIVLFVILSVIGLGEQVRPVEWVGVGIITIALIILSASLSTEPISSVTPHGLLTFSLTVVTLSAAAIAVDPTPQRPVGTSVASGLLLGLGSVYAKGLANAWPLGGAGIYLPLTIIANVIGFVLMQAAFQSGRGVVVMPLFATLSNLVPIVGGIVVFDEALPEHGAAAVLRPLAFVLALVGAAVLAGFGERAPVVGAAPTVQAENANSR